MANKATGNGSQPQQAPEGITRITVGGFKSISTEQSIEIRPLTLLAGANSSGKSSIMQPLLALKQTLEAPYDPGALLLNGPNVRFTSADQLLSSMGVGKNSLSFSVRLNIALGDALTVIFSRRPHQGLVTDFMQVGDKLSFRTGMSSNDIINQIYDDSTGEAPEGIEFTLVQDRIFLRPVASAHRSDGLIVTTFVPMTDMKLTFPFERHLSATIHLPGLRLYPKRTDPVTAVSRSFPGTFDVYTASVVAEWQRQEQAAKVDALQRGLTHLGLTKAITAAPINDTQVELRVGRLPHRAGGEQDMVSIADVGFGVSQTLPVLVALLVAEPGQLSGHA